MPRSCVEIPTNPESFELRTTAVIPFLDDRDSAGKLVNRLKSLFWSLMKWGWNVSYFRSPEPIRIYHFDAGTGFSDSGSVYSHLISVWFRNYFKKMSLLIQDSGNNLFKFFLRKIHATEKHSSRYDFIGFCLRNISVKWPEHSSGCS